MKNNLILDGQLFQTGAWHRGMAKLTVSVIADLLTLKDFSKDWELSVLLTTQIQDAGRTAEIKEELPGVEIIELDLMIPAGQYASEKQHNLSTLNAVIGQRASKYKSVHVMIPALFEHSILPVFPEGTTKHLIFHDLIPLLFPHYYLRSEEQRDFYFTRFPELFAADRIFANSITTKNDLVTYLGVNPDAITVMNGAGYAKGRVHSEAPKVLKDTKRPFVLMPTGDDARKNNQRCVEAFEAFNKQHNYAYDLALTSNFSDNTQNELRKHAKNLIFTGIVSDEGMNWLIESADLVLFGPEYEGLGMPLLEATEKNKKIACSAISVFKEISTTAYVMFDPYTVDSISEAIEKACSGPEPNLTDYKSIISKYTWRNSSEAMFQGLIESIRFPTVTSKKKKIAMLTPTPKGYSTIAKYIQELHPALSAIYDIDYYLEDHPEIDKDIKPSYLEYVANTYDVSEFNPQKYTEYDEVWYNVGNSEYHLQTVMHALNLPGLLILHDTKIKGMFDCLLRRGMISSNRYEAEASLSGTTGSEFTTTLVNSSKGVLVHSKDAKQKTTDILLAPKSIALASLSIPKPAELDLREGGEQKQFTVGFAGILTAEKGIKLLNELLAEKKLEPCTFEIFGFNFASDHAILHDYKNNPRVRITTNLNDHEFQEKLENLDILVNYRAKYFGETSRLTIEAMRYGVCTIVRRVGWFDELPDDSVVKLDSEEGIIRVIDTIIHKPEALEAVRANAKKYVSDNCSPAQYVADMIELASEVSDNRIPEALGGVWSDEILKQPIPTKVRDTLVNLFERKGR